MPTTSTLPPPKLPPSTLPQLVTNTPSDMIQRLSRLSVLFRVFDEASTSILDGSRGFVAHKFRSMEIDKIASLLPTRYDRGRESLEHIRNFNRGKESPWISTSPLWIWAVMECVKRVRRNSRNVRLAVIDISKLNVLDTPTRKVFYGSEIVADSTAQTWANNPQEILVYGVIPRGAVVSWVALSEIVPALPGFFSRSLTRPLRDHSDIIGWSSTKWSWFQEANASLLQTTLPSWCRKKSPEQHGLAAYDLALALIQNAWKHTRESIMETAIQARERYDHEEPFDRTMEALSHKLFAAHIHREDREVEDIDLEEQYDQACKAVDGIMLFVKLLAGKIASWGLDWTQDDGDNAWREVGAEVERNVKAEASKFLSPIYAILDPGDDDPFDRGHELFASEDDWYDD